MNVKNPDSYSFSFFGKLPQFPDFIKHKSVSTEFAILDEWLQSGIAYAKSSLKNNWKEIYSLSGVVEFYFPVKKNNSVIAGILVPSVDKSNREFPFIIFSVLPEKIFSSENTFLVPLQLNRFYYQAKQLYKMAYEATDTTSIINSFDKAETKPASVLSAQNIFDEYLASTTLNDLCKRFDCTNMNSSASSDSKLFSYVFSTDDENYNLDSGFLVLMSSLLNHEKDNNSFIFKSRTENFKTKLMIRNAQPVPSDFVEMLNPVVEGNNLNHLVNAFNPDTTLKDFIYELHHQKDERDSE
ncbi:MAG: type VI secretion system-associated protein TagF [Ignavibacteriales bacterium]|nr:MAG: type VI secretion system-associated protein TagF [Ignavibacteriales bacterium]